MVKLLDGVLPLLALIGIAAQAHVAHGVAWLEVDHRAVIGIRRVKLAEFVIKLSPMLIEVALLGVILDGGGQCVESLGRVLENQLDSHLGQMGHDLVFVVLLGQILDAILDSVKGAAIVLTIKIDDGQQGVCIPVLGVVLQLPAQVLLSHFMVTGLKGFDSALVVIAVGALVLLSTRVKRQQHAADSHQPDFNSFHELQ